MKRSLLVIGLLALVAFGANGNLSAAPLVGTWNAGDLGTAALNGNTDQGIFGGNWLFTDPNYDGTTVGDRSYARDASALSGPGNPYYWASVNYTTVSILRGDLEYLGNNRYRQHFETVKAGGTTYLYGNHLWGQEDGSIYAATNMQQTSSGYTYLVWLPDREQFGFERTEGSSYSWGIFAGYPSLMLEITSDFYLGQWANVAPYGVSMYGTLNNVEFEISDVAPVPEPATLVLLGGGLLGLLSTRKATRRISGK